MQALGLADHVSDIKLNNRLEHDVTVESESTVNLLLIAAYWNVVQQRQNQGKNPAL